MTKYISHRGNITGKNEKYENHPEYIKEAIYKGYDVEIDVWFDDNWFLGHNFRTYPVELSWLIKYDNIEALWCHAKTIETLYELQRNNIHCFFHNTDSVTLTSDGYLWTYPGYKLTKYSICVLPEQVHYSEEDLNICYGICSDNIKEYV